MIMTTTTRMLMMMIIIIIIIMIIVIIIIVIVVIVIVVVIVVVTIVIINIIITIVIIILLIITIILILIIIIIIIIIRSHLGSNDEAVGIVRAPEFHQRLLSLVLQILPFLAHSIWCVSESVRNARLQNGFPPLSRGGGVRHQKKPLAAL